MPLFKENGFFKVLDSGKYIRKYGARFVDCRTEEEVYFGFADGLNPDIPMAFEVPRADFDRDLLEYAKSQGATVYQPEKVIEFDLLADGVRVQTDKNRFEAEYIIDVSGRDSLIGKRLKMRQINPDLNNLAVFGHFTGVKRREGLHEGDITVALLPNRAWIWIIPFKGGITSVGAVASEKFTTTPDLQEYFNAKLQLSRTACDFMKNAERISDFHCIGNYSHTCDSFYGERWILSGDAAMFLDPIFSSGVHMSCSSSKFAAETVIKALASKRPLTDPDLGAPYEAKVRKGAKRFHGLISLFYGGQFVPQMKRTLVRDNLRRGFTSAVAGDVWDDSNFLFQKNVL
jgi:flavin-dependent dehydrogenase